MKRIGILGSTGSVGLSALQVVRDQKEFLKVTILAAKSNIKLLKEQIREFRPELVVVFDEQKGRELAQDLKGEPVRIVWGEEGLLIAAVWEGVDQLLFAMAGSKGLVPLCEAIRSKKDVAVANKEPLVMAGSLIQQLVAENGVQLTPVDSEHSAIWQCLEGHQKQDLLKIHLTASGGPFLSMPKAEMEVVGKSETLKHPRWEMGEKITVDSATLMNKGLEVIEAVSLFKIKPEQIEVLIHPEAIIHSLVEFCDGSILGQLSDPDMRLPIQYALSYPKRFKSSYSSLDLTKLGKLTFQKPDLERFPALELAFDAVELGGSMPVVLNAANEVAVSLFLAEKIKFFQITDLIRKVMDVHEVVQSPTLNSILEIDKWARETTEEMNSAGIAI